MNECMNPTPRMAAKHRDAQRGKHPTLSPSLLWSDESPCDQPGGHGQTGQAAPAIWPSTSWTARPRGSCPPALLHLRGQSSSGLTSLPDGLFGKQPEITVGTVAHGTQQEHICGMTVVPRAERRLGRPSKACRLWLPCLATRAPGSGLTCSGPPVPLWARTEGTLGDRWPWDCVRARCACSSVSGVTHTASHQQTVIPLSPRANRLCVVLLGSVALLL